MKRTLTLGIVLAAIGGWFIQHHRSEWVWVERPMDPETIPYAATMCASPVFFDAGQDEPTVTLGNARYRCGPDEIRFEVRVQRKDS